MEAREQLRLLNKQARHGGEHLVLKDAENKGGQPARSLAHRTNLISARRGKQDSFRVNSTIFVYN